MNSPTQTMHLQLKYGCLTGKRNILWILFFTMDLISPTLFFFLISFFKNSM